jgi:hypothetical protein
MHVIRANISPLLWSQLACHDGPFGAVLNNALVSQPSLVGLLNDKIRYRSQYTATYEYK